MFKNDLWVSTCDNCVSFLHYLTKNNVFLASYISYKFQDVILFFCCVVVHCVNVPHLLYLFFSRREFRLFIGSVYDKKCCYKYSWAHALVAWLSILLLWICTQSSITGFWGRLLPNFLNNHHINIQRGCTTSSMNFLWDSSTFCQENGEILGIKH